MKATKTLLYILISLITSTSQAAEHYYFKHYQVDDGLLHNNVTSIMQDRLGFMWVGTRGGLNRFDGNTFKSYFISCNRSGANYIKVLREDKKGLIWVGTTAGLFKFDPQSESFHSFNLFPNSTVRDIQIDHQNNLWIIAGGSLYKYEQKSGKCIAFDVRVTAFDLDDEGNLWLATTAGYIKQLNTQNHHIQRFHLPGKMPFEKASINQITYLHGDLLIGTIRDLLLYKVQDRSLKALLSKEGTGSDVFVRHIYTLDNKCYIATESGLYIFNTAYDQLKHLEKKASDPYALNDNAAYTVYADNRNGVWVGTFFGGLNYYAAETSVFKKYYPSNASNTISGNAIREICEDKEGNIWIGTEDAGISKLDTCTGLFTHITHENPLTGLSYPNIHGLLIDEDDLLAGPFVHGLEVMDLRGGKIKDRHPFLRSGNNHFSNLVMSLYKTADGRILVGTTGAGLFEYIKPLKRLKQIADIPERSYVYAIAEDHTGTIYTGSLANGAFYYNPTTGARGNYNFNQVNDTLKNYFTVQGIYEDSRHTLWFTTEGGGLIKLDSTRKKVKRFTTDDGLPTNNLYRVLEDDAGNLWISSIKGLICFNIRSERPRVYTKSNGLLTDQFNYNSAYKDKEGNMYFGSVKGMISFHPRLLSHDNSPPPTYITQIQVNNKDMRSSDSLLLKRSTLYTDSITLNAQQTSFNVEFAALDFASPEVIQYKYRMEGLDHKWTYLQKERKAYFTGLPPGTYRFTVQAESNVGHWIGKPRNLTIVITPPFWKSLTAFILYVFIAISIILLLIYAYHQRIKQKNKRRQQLFELAKEKEVYQTKIDFFTNIAHEIQTPLTLIKGPLEWAMSQLNDVETVKRNLQLVEKNTDRLVTLTTQLLDFRKMEINQFGLNFVITDITEMIRNCVERFLPEIDKRLLQLQLSLPHKSIKAPIDQEAFIKMISNLLSNAIKYGKQRIVVTLCVYEKQPCCFKISISNDGPLIEEVYREKIFEPFFRIPCHKDIKGTGIGLPLAKSLAELHQGQLTFMVQSVKLNVFELTLPLQQNTAFKHNIDKNSDNYERSTITH